MAERTNRAPDDGPVGDRLQPSLLDRLTDDAPGERAEASDQVAMTRTRLRRAVLRDLAWLFNATSLAVDIPLENHPEARASTINFGIAALAGSRMSEIEFADLEQTLREAIVVFEPRLLEETVQVRSITQGDQLAHHNTLGFEVRAKLWSTPYPLELLLRSNLDLETGHVVLEEQSGTAV